MKRVTDALAAYVPNLGHLGQRGATGIPRSDLIRMLESDRTENQRVLLLWGTAVAVTLAFLVVDGATQMIKPTYASLPAAAAVLLWILRRVESVWRETRLQNLAITIAILTEDEAELKRILTTLNAAILAALTVKNRSDEKADDALVARGG